jgi:hypothetical protein
LRRLRQNLLDSPGLEMILVVVLSPVPAKKCYFFCSAA